MELTDLTIQGLTDIIAEVLAKEPRLVFAYLYGSAIRGAGARDIDIAVYSSGESDPHELSAELKIALSHGTALPPDVFDIRVINHLLERGDLFALVYLRNVFSGNLLISDKDEAVRTSFIESFNLKYRECEGLMDEVVR
jgi:uncharacterized protein